MKWIFIISLALTVSLYSDDHIKAVDFYHRYAVMCEMVTGDNEAKEAAFKIMKSDPKAADFIGSFWRQKALHSNQVALTHLGQSFEVDLKQAGGNESKINEAKKRYEEGLGMHFVIYYYDHADEIKKMIKARLVRMSIGEAESLPLPGVKDP